MKCYFALQHPLKKNSCECGHVLRDMVPLQNSKFNKLTHSFPMHPFSTPLKHRKTVRFSDVSKGKRKGALGTNGLHMRCIHKQPFKDVLLDDSSCALSYHFEAITIVTNKTFLLKSGLISFFFEKPSH